MQPNIVLITTDQQRYDSLACNGSAFMRTPALDALAARGARFTRAYCTNPVCTPSRVSLFTGCYPSTHGSYNIGTQPGGTGGFLSSVLRRAGYQTHHIGKAHFYPWDIPSPETRTPVDYETPWRDFAGFETAEIATGHTLWGLTGHYEKWLNAHGIYKGRSMPQLQVRRLFEDDPYETGDWDLPVPLHFGGWAAERAAAFLDARPSGRPFFLNIGFQDPHHPHVLPSGFANRVPPEAVPPPRAGFDPALRHLQALAAGNIETSRFAGPHGMAGNTSAHWAAYSRDAHKAAVTAAYYYSMVQLMDSQVGDILAGLESRGLLQDTLFVFTSDHGDMLLHHGLGQKGPVAFEDVLRVPLLLSWPGHIAPGVCEQVASLADVAPTVLQLAGVNDAPACDGQSLAPALAGQRLARGGVRAEFTEDAGAISYRCWITDGWKLVEYPGEEYGELYHLAEDAGEEHNLYHNPAFAQQRAALAGSLLQDMVRTERRNPRPCRC